MQQDILSWPSVSGKEDFEINSVFFVYCDAGEKKAAEEADARALTPCGKNWKVRCIASYDKIKRLSAKAPVDVSSIRALFRAVDLESFYDKIKTESNSSLATTTFPSRFLMVPNGASANGNSSRKTYACVIHLLESAAAVAEHENWTRTESTKKEQEAEAKLQEVENKGMGKWIQGMFEFRDNLFRNDVFWTHASSWNIVSATAHKKGGVASIELPQAVNAFVYLHNIKTNEISAQLINLPKKANVDQGNLSALFNRVPKKIVHLVQFTNIVWAQFGGRGGSNVGYGGSGFCRFYCLQFEDGVPHLPLFKYADRFKTGVSVHVNCLATTLETFWPVTVDPAVTATKTPPTYDLRTVVVNVAAAGWPKGLKCFGFEVTNMDELMFVELSVVLELAAAKGISKVTMDQKYHQVKARWRGLQDGSVEPVLGLMARVKTIARSLKKAKKREVLVWLGEMHAYKEEMVEGFAHHAAPALLVYDGTSMECLGHTRLSVSPTHTLNLSMLLVGFWISNLLQRKRLTEALLWAGSVYAVHQQLPFVREDEWHTRPLMRGLFDELYPESFAVAAAAPTVNPDSFTFSARVLANYLASKLTPTTSVKMVNAEQENEKLQDAKVDEELAALANWAWEFSGGSAIVQAAEEKKGQKEEEEEKTTAKITEEQQMLMSAEMAPPPPPDDFSSKREERRMKRPATVRDLRLYFAQHLPAEEAVLVLFSGDSGKAENEGTLRALYRQRFRELDSHLIDKDPNPAVANPEQFREVYDKGSVANLRHKLIVARIFEPCHFIRSDGSLKRTKAEILPSLGEKEKAPKKKEAQEEVAEPPKPKQKTKKVEAEDAEKKIKKKSKKEKATTSKNEKQAKKKLAAVQQVVNKNARMYTSNAKKAKAFQAKLDKFVAKQDAAEKNPKKLKKLQADANKFAQQAAKAQEKYEAAVAKRNTLRDMLSSAN